MSPLERTMAQVRAESWIPWKVEQWIHQSGTRRDLFNIIDVLAITSGRTLGIQVFGAGELRSHLDKINFDRRNMAVAWLEAGNELQLWQWKKYTKKIDGLHWRPSIYTVARGQETGLEITLVVDGKRE